MNPYYRLLAAGALFTLLTVASSVDASAAPLITSTTTLTITPNPGKAGAPVTLTATITPQTPEAPTGTVQFSAASSPTVIYTAPVINGAATLILEPVAGSYTYTAVYSGDTNFAGSTSAPVVEGVTMSTTTTLAVNPNPALLGSEVTLTASVSPTTATGTVTFYDLSTVVGVATVSTGVATFQAILLPSGLRSLYARYSGDSADAPSISAIVSAAVISKPGLGLAQMSTLTAGSGPITQVLGDFNGDGKPDIAVLNTSGSNIQIFLGTGTGAFTTGNSLPTGAGAAGLVTGDFNGDGIPDLAVAAADGVEVLYGTGGGAFSSYVTTSITGAATNVTVADFNNDGLPDIAAVSSTTLTILVSTGPGFNTTIFPTLSIGSSAAAAIAAGDFNSDGLADLVVITPSGAGVILNASNLTAATPTYAFAAPVVYPAGSGPDAVLVKDVNTDGNPDLLIANSTDGTVSVLLGTANGTFTSHGAFAAGANPTSISSSDFNGDGIADLIVTNQSAPTSQNVSVLLGMGNGSYRTPLVYGSANSGPNSIVVADFNGDFIPDVAILSSSNEVEILLNLFATLSPSQGNTQTTAINNAFALPLQVTATAFGTPAANVPVTFTAPGSGASGFFAGVGATATAVSNASGIATAPTYIANGTAGENSVAVTGGNNTPLSFMLTNNAQTCTFTVTPNAAIFVDANGGSQLFTVTASLPNCMWNAASASSSVLFGTTSGTGNGVVNVLFPANTTGYDIIETVLIAGIPISATILGTTQIFADVPPSAFYFDAANLMYTKGVTKGCSSSPLDYCPNNPVTRDEMAYFIVTAIYGVSCGTPPCFTLNNPGTQYFIDVPPSDQFYPEVEKMYELGVTLGCAGTAGVNLQYCPTASVNREQMAEFIIKARYGAGTSFDIPPSPYFTDVPALDDSFYNYVQRMAFDGITEGCTVTTFCPTQTVERYQMAIFMMKGLFNSDVGTGIPTQTTPEITSISPASIPLGQTTTVTVTGSNTSFDSSTAVNLVAGNQPSAAYTVGTVTVNSTTSLTVQLTPVEGVITTQPYSIYITTSDQSQEVVLPNALTIVAEP
jgi:hypothetical protein